MVQKGRNANGMTTMIQARHFPHNNINNLNTFYTIYVTINKQQEQNNQTEANYE